MNFLPFDNLINLVFSISIWSVVKLMVLFALLIYAIFALVIVKQVNLMTETLCDQLEIPLKIVAAFHLAGAIFILFLAFVIL